MTTHSLRTLIGLFVASLITLPCVGGLDTSTLFAIYSVLLISIPTLAGGFGSSASDAVCQSSAIEDIQAERRTWQTLFTTSALAYLLALALAVLVSPMPAFVAEQALAMGLLPVTYLFVRAQLRSKLAWETIWSLFRLLAIALAVFALIERLLTDGRAYTVMSDPNVLAGFFNVFVLTSFAGVAIQFRTAEKFWLCGKELGVLLLFAAAQGTAGSLSGLVCLFLLLPVITAFATRGVMWQRKALILVLGVSTLLLAAASSGGSIETPGTKLQGISQHSSFTVRVAMIRSSLAIYQDHPWYGSGLVSFKLYYPNYRSPLDSGTGGDLVHNDYVQFLQEGGPLLLGSLLLLFGLVLTRTGVIIFKGWRSGPSHLQLMTAGQGCALLALLLHAAMNFIFYVAPLALLFGVLLAGYTPAHGTITKHRVPSDRKIKLIFGSLIFAAALLLTATLGARSLFLAITQQRCELHACLMLRSNPTFLKKLSAYLAGTQPTWLPVRQYLISNSLATEQTVTAADEKAKWRANAFRETLSLLQDVPTMPWLYASLADLIGRDASLAAKLPDDLPREDTALYRLALAHNTLDLSVRLQLAQRFVQNGKNDEAYLLLQEAMPHWDLALWGDGGRMQLLVQMLNLAVALHRCDEAAAMSASLRTFLKLQREAETRGAPLPFPPGDLPPPLTVEGEKAVALAGGCA